MQKGFDNRYDSGEDYVRDKIEQSLRRCGKSVRAVSNRHCKGRDIEVSGRPRQIIEVKGFPSSMISQGKNRGKRKSEAKRESQARKWLWDAIRQLMEHKSENRRDRIALGLPADILYFDLLHSLDWFRRIHRIDAYFVTKSRGSRVRLYRYDEKIEY